jgi:hypothetical protein
MKTSDNKTRDYTVHSDARIFQVEFYYINFVDCNNKFNSKFSEKFTRKIHCLRKANWIIQNRWSLKEIPYSVAKIGVYSSRTGHLKSLSV